MGDGGGKVEITLGRGGSGRPSLGLGPPLPIHGHREANGPAANPAVLDELLAPAAGRIRLHRHFLPAVRAIDNRRGH